jgi:hypothetical protein
MSPSDGKQQALAHLDKARSTNYLDPQAVHVQANLIVKLAGIDHAITSPDSVDLIGRALSEVDRALLLLVNPNNDHRQKNSVQMLENIRDQVFLKVGTVDVLKEQAERIWTQFKGQQGFVLVARKLFLSAIDKNKGSIFKKALDYCQMVENRVRGEGLTPLPALYEAALHIIYRWQIQRAQVSPLGFRIEWERVERYSRAVLTAPALASDPFYKYLFGLSLAHQGDWQQSNAVLSDIRNSSVVREFLWEPRDYLLGDMGGPRKVQGEMRRPANDLYFFATDFYTERNREWPREKEIAHAFIRFSFGGTKAIKCD